MQKCKLTLKTLHCRLGKLLKLSYVFFCRGRRGDILSIKVTPGVPEPPTTTRSW